MAPSDDLSFTMRWRVDAFPVVVDDVIPSSLYAASHARWMLSETLKNARLSSVPPPPTFLPPILPPLHFLQLYEIYGEYEHCSFSFSPSSLVLAMVGSTLR